MGLAGRVALVTGGGRGIGRAIALRLADEGASVAVNCNKSTAEASLVVEAIRAAGGRSMVARADVTGSAEVKRMVTSVIEQLGGIDILVNNAGVVSRQAFLDLTLEEWDRVHSTNLRSFFLVAQEVARVMKDQGRGGKILNVSSRGAKDASLNATAYSTSKAGVTMLTKQMALELAPYDINVNEVCPGLIETDLNRALLADPAYRERRLSIIPLRRIGTPEDVAGAAAFLVSDEARLITGASLFIDGGASIW